MPGSAVGARFTLVEDVAVRGPPTDLLLIIYKRRPARSVGIEILGDVQLLDEERGRASVMMAVAVS